MSSPPVPRNSKKAIRGGRSSAAIPKRATNPHIKKALPEKPSMGKPRIEKPLVEQPIKIGKLLVGIDLGTTRVAVATKEVLYDPPQQSSQSKELPGVFCHWPASSQSGDYRFPSTSIYYSCDGGLPITGNDLTLLVEDPNFEPQRLIRQLKILFHNHNNDPTTLAMHARVQLQLAQAGKTADEALSDLAKVILDHLFKDIDGNGSKLGKLYDRLEELDVELVIAVPPGRSTVDHARVRQAFVQGPIKSTAVYVESEPAAMFRSWVYDGQIQGVKIRELGTGKEHVVVGSILARLDEDFLIDYPITRSKGVTQWVPVTEETLALSFYDRLAVESSPTDSDAKYVMAVKWLVKKGSQGAKIAHLSSEDNVDDAKERHLKTENRVPNKPAGTSQY